MSDTNNEKKERTSEPSSVKDVKTPPTPTKQQFSLDSEDENKK